MNFENLESVIDFAIEKEKEAADFYEEVSLQESFSGAKEMLKEFAAQERKHQSILEDLKAGAVDESVSKYKLKWIPDIKRSDYAVDMEYKKGMGYNDLLMLAMKQEEKALKLYNQMLDQAENEDTKKVFQILCQEEAKHKLSLETMYDDYMAKMGD